MTPHIRRIAAAALAAGLVVLTACSQGGNDQNQNQNQNQNDQQQNQNQNDQQQNQNQ